MNKKTKSNADLKVFVSLLQYDVEKRFEVLNAELCHLLSLIESRIGGDAKEQSKHGQHAFLDRLAKSVKEMSTECSADRDEIDAYRKETGKIRTEDPLAFPPSNGTEGQTYYRLIHFDILWHAKMATKATVLAERLGDLHDRLDQFLQRTNPDHPDPTLRRRSEDGLGDKFLMELARWTYRSLASFATTSLGAEYPYLETPSTYQFWTYHHTSRHHSFTTTEAHSEWASWLDGVTEQMAKYRQPTTIPKIKSPRKFAAIALSYWMPERIALQPIIGHELAHQLIRDIYGREVDLSTLARDKSGLAFLYRSITDCVESWIVARGLSSGAAPKTASNLTLEIVCDLLALSRFGAGYVYAWTLEILVDETFSALFHDEHGMIQRFDVVERGNDSSQVWAKRFRTLETMAIRLVGALPTIYLRGRVLHAAAQQLSRECLDPVAREMLAAHAKILDVLLDIYSGADFKQRAFNLAFADDLVDVVVAQSASKKYRASQAGSEKYVRAVDAFWESEGSRLKNPLLERQVVSRDLLDLIREIVQKETCEKGGQQFSVLASSNDFGLTDLAWRIEWYMECQKLSDPGAYPTKNFRNQIRALTLCAKDDYLFRTGSPRHLARVLLGEQLEGHSAFLPSITSNKFESAAVRSSHNEKILEQIHEILTIRNRNSTDVESKEYSVEVPCEGLDPVQTFSVTVKSEMLDWLHSIYFGRGYLREWILNGSGSPQAFTLHLLRARSSHEMVSGRAHAYDFLKARFKPDESALDFPKQEGNLVDAGLLLGRYDAFALAEGVVYLPNSNSALGRSAKLVSRSKRLVRVGGKGSDIFETRAIILISLRWEVLRTIVARWLTGKELVQSDRYANCKFDVFLSDGWEDLVIRLGISQGSEENLFVKEIQSLIGRLNLNKMIASTETLFTPEILKSDAIDARFVLNFGDGETSPVPADDVLEDIKLLGLTIHNVAGHKDLEFRPSEKGRAVLPALHQKLHESFKGGNRIETIVTWNYASLAPT